MVSSFLFCKSTRAQTNQITKAKLNGSWVLNGIDSYWTGLTFDSTETYVIISSYADTVSVFPYKIQSDLLIIDDGHKTTKNKIISLTKDSLIFSNFQEYTKRQVYFKLK
jgi:hypothetical protein